jgi:hypothetical protein
MKTALVRFSLAPLGSAQGEAQGANLDGSSRPIISAAALPNPQMLQTTEAKLRTAEAELKATRGRLEQQTTKTVSLQNQLTEQRVKVGVRRLARIHRSLQRRLSLLLPSLLAASGAGSRNEGEQGET